MAHSAVFMPGSLSVIACPSQNQSAEALRKVKDMVLKAGANSRLTMCSGSSLPTGRAYWRCLALKSRAADSLSMPGSLPMKPLNWIQLLWRHYIRCGPSVRMRVLRCCQRHGAARIHSGRSGTTTIQSWMRIRATVDVEPTLIASDVLDRARRQLSEDDFKREYLGIPAGSQVSPFTLELYESRDASCGAS